MLLTCFGDSLTFGYGVAPSKCWVSLLKSAISMEVINSGVNGNTTAAMLERSYDDITSKKPSIVIIMGGTNDFFMGLNHSYVIENLKLLINDLATNNILPIVLSPPSIINDMANATWSGYTDYVFANKELELLNRSLKAYCNENNYLFVSLFDIFKSYCGNNKLLYIDGVHFSYTGHVLVYDELIKLEPFSRHI